MNLKDRIEVDPAICAGRPRVKGTRLTVEFLLGVKAAGWTEAQILESYPHLVMDDLRAVYAFAQGVVGDDTYVPFPEVA